MFTFLNSSILAGLLAALIPLIILLITRQKIKKVYFSSLIFLRELKSQKIRNIKLRHILLLIIRTLIIILLILAFARPTLKGKFTMGFTSRAKSTIVLIIDNSLSMSREENGTSLLSRALDKMNDVIEMFTDGDEIYLISGNSKAEFFYEGPRFSVNSIRKLLNSVEASQHSTNLNTAVSKAYDIFNKSNNINKELFVFSDFQKTGLEKLEEDVHFRSTVEDIKVYLLPFRVKDFSNLSVRDIKVGNQIFQRGKTIDIAVSIQNNGIYDERDKMVQLLINGKRVSQASLNLSKDQIKTVSLKFTPEAPGIMSGTIALEDDDLLADNRKYFTLNIPGKTKVLVLTSDREGLKYLNYALNIFPNIEYEIVDSNEAYNINFDQFDILITANLSTINSGLDRKIEEFLTSGKSLLFFPGDQLDIGNYNHIFNKKYRLPQIINAKGQQNKRDLFVTFSYIDYEHVVLNTIFSKKPEQFDSPHFNYYMESTENRESRTIIRLSDNSPFLTETNFKGGKLFYFASALNEKWSDFTLKSIYIPLTHQTINFGLTNNYLNKQFYLIDNKISKSYKVKNQINELTVLAPDQNRIFISPDIEKSAITVNFLDANTTGIYKLLEGSELFDVWAINFNDREVEFDVIDDAELVDYFGKDNYLMLNEESNLMDSIASARFGVELWKYFLLFVLFLILIEMLISRESKKSDLTK